MYNINNQNDFSIFIASGKAKEMVKLKVTEAEVSNNKFLSENTSKPVRMAITGTFIYAHPPNYLGRPMHNYSVKDWAKLMESLKLAGMDTVIFQASVWNELKECYYPSTHFSKFKQWNVVEPMLEAAKNIGMIVYLGGYGSVAGWKEHLTQADINKEKENHINCFREILKYSELFDGIYFVPETAFLGERNLKKEFFLNDIYREYCGFVKQEAPEKKILMSPATKYFPNKMNEMIDSWQNILKEVPLDIMVPQDSIGTCGNQLIFQQKTYNAWDKICRQQGIEFWSNIEIFECEKHIKGGDYLFPANPERVSAQINNATPYAKKLICWEAPFFMFDNSNKRCDLTQFLSNLNKG